MDRQAANVRIFSLNVRQTQHILFINEEASVILSDKIEGLIDNHFCQPRFQRALSPILKCMDTGKDSYESFLEYITQVLLIFNIL